VEGVKTYGGLYDQVFAGVKARRGDQPTVYLATTSINGNLVPASDSRTVCWRWTRPRRAN
jgi:hypothetical protein